MCEEFDITLNSGVIREQLLLAGAHESYLSDAQGERSILSLVNENYTSQIVLISGSDNKETTFVVKKSYKTDTLVCELIQNIVIDQECPNYNTELFFSLKPGQNNLESVHMEVRLNDSKFDIMIQQSNGSVEEAPKILVKRGEEEGGLIIIEDVNGVHITILNFGDKRYGIYCGKSPIELRSGILAAIESMRTGDIIPVIPFKFEEIN